MIYDIIQSTSAKQLIEKVNLASKAGWKIQGGIHHVKSEGGSTTTFMQSMTHRNKKAKHF